MTPFQTIILSAIEGLTEFLPISSTGHLILAEHFLNIPQTEFLKTFDIFIQLGAILAVVIIYFSKLRNNLSLWPKIAVAFIPTGILGLIFYKIVKQFLLGNVFITTISLLLGGIFLIVFEKYFAPSQNKLTYHELSKKNFISIGIIQSLSMIPGVSRSASSIVGGMLNKMSRQDAVEFSFFLAIPTIFMASAYDLLKTGINFSNNEISLLLLGFVLSFLFAIVAIKSFIKIVNKFGFIPFGIYRILLALLVLFTLG